MMHKPTFEATYKEDAKILHLVMHEPEVLGGSFGGFEVMKKSGDFDSQEPWQSVVNLTADVRKVEMEGLEPSLKYAVTVRGRVLPNGFSELADPLVFETMESVADAPIFTTPSVLLMNVLTIPRLDVSLPHNVKLHAISPFAVDMSWNPPVTSNGRIAGYTVEWYLNFTRQEDVHLTPSNMHTFNHLEPGQTVSATICARFKMETLVKFDYIGSSGDLKSASTPKQGMLKPTFEATYFADAFNLRLLIHEPRDVAGSFGGFEVLMKMSGSTLQKQWQSVANLTANEREYQIDKLESLATYAVTVRGRVLPDIVSTMADALVFEVVPADLTAPLDVSLHAIDLHTVKMAWSPPAKPTGRIIGYTIEWSLDYKWQKSINVASNNYYTFTNLKPQQTIFAAVYTRTQVAGTPDFVYVGGRSRFLTATTLLQQG
ncbi:unnamed protein product [Hydatigera taeniaeformis]|uniref:Fibronectin type-III domain-containing protein n=1 Tax=Hydatigena taeniaeformis TaxID=6205 RepID=A0A0R3WRB1_HYDTA|nr:unnamed protein product [Hydatigera taeniaeformis]